MTDLALTEEVVGGVAIVTVTGEADLYGAPQLREALLRMDKRGHSRIVLDMTACEFLDSTGMGVIVGGLKRARARDGDLAIAGAPEPVLRTFRIMGLLKVFRAFESRDQAVAGMAAPEGGSADA